MCRLNKCNGRSSSPRVDPCMKKLLESLERYGFETLACCCGHKRYHITVVCKEMILTCDMTIKNNRIFDLISGVEIPRKKRFYVRDKQGYYFIPEVERYYAQSANAK